MSALCLSSSLASCVTVMHSLIDRLKSASILIRCTFTGNVMVVEYHRLLFPCSSCRPTLHTGTVQGWTASPPFMAYLYIISAARAIDHMGGPMLLHRLASALQVKDPHRLPPSNVPVLH